MSEIICLQPAPGTGRYTDSNLGVLRFETSHGTKWLTRLEIKRDYSSLQSRNEAGVITSLKQA